MFWQIYNTIAVLAIASQILLLWHAVRNYRYTLRKSGRRDFGYKPQILLTVPCKGIDRTFETNIASILLQDYPHWDLHFVVEDASDPAYERLCQLQDKYADRCKAREVRIFMAGQARGCGQKIHNLLYSCRQAPEDTAVFAFADSDACLKPYWLAHLISPLRRDKFGASTGYRWFVPQDNAVASLALSACNAKLAQLLGNTPFNLAWGGSMAIRADMFRKTQLDRIWASAISDDLCLTYAVKKTGRKVAYAPACLVASYEKTTWPALFEFGRRQFVITRVTLPGSWWFGLFSSLYAILGLWGSLIAVIVAVTQQIPDVPLVLYSAVPAVFVLNQLTLSILRQRMIARLLPEDADRLKPAARADIALSWLWSWVLFACILSAAFGRTITWRKIRYRLIGRTATQIVKSDSD